MRNEGETLEHSFNLTREGATSSFSISSLTRHSLPSSRSSWLSPLFVDTPVMTVYLKWWLTSKLSTEQECQLSERIDSWWVESGASNHENISLFCVVEISSPCDLFNSSEHKSSSLLSEIDFISNEPFLSLFATWRRERWLPIFQLTTYHACTHVWPSVR